MMQWLVHLWLSHSVAVSGVVFGVVGALGAHLWQRFRDRTAMLRWIARHERLASAGADASLGTVRVTFDGTLVDNVFLSTVELENGSQRDLADLDIHLAHTDGFTFLGGIGNLVGSQITFAFSTRFHAEVERIAQLAPESQEHAAGLTYLRTHREYRVPVLNRGGRAVIVHTVTGPRGARPFVLVDCDHTGVRTRIAGPRAMILGVPRAHALAAGAIAGLVLTALVANLTKQVWIAAFAGLLIGEFTTLIGLPIVWLFRQAVRLLG